MAAFKVYVALAIEHTIWDFYTQNGLEATT